MNSKLAIELFEEHQNATFYTIRFEKESSEKIGLRGALERYFRPEGKIKDDVFAIPIETNRLRLYVIRITDEIVVIGNGGRKKTKTYNEDAELNLYVNQLQRIDNILKLKMKRGLVRVKRKHLTGELKFDY